MSTLTKEEIEKLTDSLQYGNDVAQENARRWAESLFKQRAAEAGNSVLAMKTDAMLDFLLEHLEEPLEEEELLEATRNIQKRFG